MGAIATYSEKQYGNNRLKLRYIIEIHFEHIKLSPIADVNNVTMQSYLCLLDKLVNTVSTDNCKMVMLLADLVVTENYDYNTCTWKLYLRNLILETVGHVSVFLTLTWLVCDNWNKGLGN